MKINRIISWGIGLAVTIAGCTTNESTDNQKPLPTEEYVRVELISGCGYNAATEDSEVTRASWNDANGSGDMVLQWERAGIDSDNTDKLTLIISDGEKPLYGNPSPQPDSSSVGVSHSGLSVTPREGDAHHAEFHSVNYYSTEELQGAAYCYVVAGNAQIVEDAESGEHRCHLEMPSRFTQSANCNPSFLSDYMYMYAETAYRGDDTTLEFKHIPATFRFIITSSKVDAMSLQEVSVSVADNSAIASKSAELVFDLTNKEVGLSFGDSSHDRVSVITENGAALAQGEKYTAYAMALPLPDNNAFKGKTLNFSVKSDNEEQVAFQLNDAKLAEINGSDIYNWIGGKSYTVRIDIREDGKATGEILADNRIEVKPVKSGIYTLLYEGEDGAPLADYAAICTLPINELAYYEYFINVNIAPRAAKNIGIYNSAGERQGTIPLDNFKPDFSESPLYSFGLLSDVHIGRAEINPDTDFERALNLFNSKNVAQTCICGDITQNGKEAELQVYKDLLILADAPVYATTGNHDATTSGINPERWTKYSGLPLVFERSVEHNGTVDHFLFLGMERWNFSAAYLDYHLDWLESKLQEYRNERCFVITHLFFPDRAGNLNGIYPSGNWLKGAQLEALQNMCDKYVNSVWFSGHSHWEWWLQQFQDRANIYRSHVGTLPSCGWCVHVPSCGAPITSDGTSREDNTAGSEGAIVEVYENHVDILGIDFISGKFLPIATYRLDTTIQNLSADNSPRPNYYISASDFVVNQSKKGATVTDIEGMPNYIEVTFTEKSQGFYVANSTYTPNATKVSITVEDVQAISNGEAIDVPVGVGFYGTNGYYTTSTNSAQISHATDTSTYYGLQFQTSKSKYGDGPLPLTLRMKVQMKFYEE